MNLTTQKDLDGLKRKEMSTMDDFLKTGECKVTWKENPLVLDKENNILLIRDGFVREVGFWQKGSQRTEWENTVSASAVERLSKHTIAVLIPSLSKRAYLIIDGDDDWGGPNIAVDSQLSTSLSCRCAAELLSAPKKRIKSSSVFGLMYSSKIKV